MPKDYAHRATISPKKSWKSRMVVAGAVMSVVVLVMLAWWCWGEPSLHVRPLKQVWHDTWKHWPKRDHHSSHAVSVQFAFYPPSRHVSHREQALLLQLPLMADQSALTVVKQRCEHAGLPLMFSQVWQQGGWWYNIEVGPFSTLMTAYRAQRQLKHLGIKARLERMA